jgi:collagenase-like PrtC family protease
MSVVNKDKTRVSIGSALSDAELERRLAIELQIPITYGARVLRAYKRVIQEALEHGEGVSLGVGKIVMEEYPTRNHTMGFQRGNPRERMYKYKFRVNRHGDAIIKEKTKENFSDI